MTQTVQWGAEHLSSLSLSQTFLSSGAFSFSLDLGKVQPSTMTRRQTNITRTCSLIIFFTADCLTSHITNQLFAFTVGPLLRINHTVCGPSMGCRNRSHSGLPGLPNPVDTFWTHVALVGVTPHWDQRATLWYSLIRFRLDKTKFLPRLCMQAELTQPFRSGLEGSKNRHKKKNTSQGI